MVEVKSLLELLEKLESEREYGSSRRFNWRVVLLPDYPSLRDFYQLLSEKDNYQIFFLEDFINSGKRWLSPGDLEKIIKQVSSNKNAVLFGLDSIIRFFSNEEVKRFFSKLFSIERLKVNSKLIIPIAGMSERVASLLRDDHRVKSREFSPLYIVRANSLNPIRLFINNVPEPLPEKLQKISELKSFVQLWKKEGNRWLIDLKKLSSLAENPSPDSAVEVVKINSLGQLISEFLGFEALSDCENEAFVRELLEEILDKGAKSWQEIVDREVFSFKEGVCQLITTSGYDGWKLSNYLKVKFPMFKEIITDSFEGTIRSLYRSSFLKEKREVLEALSSNPNWEEVACRALKEEVKYIELNTGILKCELEALLEAFSSGKISLKRLKEKSKEISCYLSQWSGEVYGQEWVHDYFDSYRLSKLKNSFPEEIKDKVSALNSDKASFNSWYYSFPPVNRSELGSKRSYLLDGVGVEWLGFIISVAKEFGFVPEKIFISKADLPSITEFNSFDGVDKLNDFDSLIHSKPYQYPASFVEQLRTVRRMLEKIFISEKEDFYLFSDHGTTNFSRLAEGLNACQSPEHDGRYCLDQIDTPFGIEWEKNGKRFTVAKLHNSLGRKPAREAHGGATPEEVLIPIIYFTRTRETVAIGITLKTTKVRRGGTLEIYFDREVEKLKVSLGGKELTVVEKTPKKAVVKIPRKVQAGCWSLEVRAENQFKAFEIEVIGGMQEEELL